VKQTLVNVVDIQANTALVNVIDIHANKPSGRKSLVTIYIKMADFFNVACKFL